MKASNIEAATFLLGRGANVDYQNKHGRTPLFRAIESANIEAVKLLLNRGADIELQDKYGKTALLWSTASTSNIEAAKLLLDRGANIDHQDKYGKTALLLASKYRGAKERVELFLDRGASIDIEDNEGETVLMLVACSKHHFFDKGYVKSLLDQGANIDHQDRKGETALLKVILNHGSTKYTKGEEAATFLLEQGAKVNYQSRNELTPLIAAICCKHLEVAKILLKQGADINQQGKDGMTPLIIAIRLMCCTSRAQEFSLYKSITKYKDTSDWDLSKAAFSEMAHWLLESGANVEPRDRYGRTALDYALDKPRPDITYRLVRATAPQDTTISSIKQTLCESQATRTKGGTRKRKRR